MRLYAGCSKARINDAAVRGLPHSSAKAVAACADVGRAAATHPACIRSLDWEFPLHIRLKDNRQVMIASSEFHQARCMRGGLKPLQPLGCLRLQC